MIKMITDAAYDVKTGKAAIGIVIYKDGQQYQLSQLLDDKANNQEAEYEAVYAGLQYILAQQWQQDTLFIYTDSDIVVKGIQRKSAKGQWQQQYLERILPLLAQFSLYFIDWQADQQNKQADKLAKQALYRIKK